MKTRLLFLALVGSFALTVTPFLRADDASVPAGGFSASRYEALWTKSPFAVASDESTPDSPDYSLVGIAEIDGISYASVIDKQNQNQHYLISSDKPSNGLTLVSVTRGHDPSDTTALIQKGGQSITLKLEIGTAAAAEPNGPPNNPINMPGSMTPQIPMPGSNMGGMGNSPFNMGQGRPPVVRFHRTPIHLPPVPTPPQPPPGLTQPPPPPTQPPPPPPQ